MLESLIGYIIEVSRGLGVTLSVFAMTLIISLPLGVIVAVCRLSKNKIICSNNSTFYDLRMWKK